MARRSIGVCYGMLGNNLPSPSDAVNLYVSNGIKAMRLYAPNDAILSALKGKGIDVMMGVDDGTLKDLATDPSAAANWVQANIMAYPTVSFKYIVVGNEIPKEYARYILPAMSKMWDAICSAGYHGKIKVSTALRFDAFTKTWPPSKAEFDRSYYNMGPIVNFLAQTGNPLFVNIYPYFSYKEKPNDITLDYALFTATTVNKDPVGYEYQNLFDAMVDSVYYALEKAGGSRVGVVVSESGWPSAGGSATTAGGRAATKKNAQTYNRNLIKHVVNGTPKRPEYLETYIFAMFNENQKPGDAVERNFGLFKPDQFPVYEIKFN